MHASSIIESIGAMDSEDEIKRILIAVQIKSTEIREARCAHARVQISELIEKFGYAGLGLIEPKPQTATLASPRIDKYRDPLSGETCSGRGAKPTWMGDRKEEFLNPDWVAKEAAKKNKTGKSTSVSESKSANGSIATSAASQITATVTKDDGRSDTSSPVDLAAQPMAAQPVIETIVDRNVETIPATINQPAPHTSIESATVIEHATALTSSHPPIVNAIDSPVVSPVVSPIISPPTLVPVCEQVAGQVVEAP